MRDPSSLPEPQVRPPAVSSSFSLADVPSKRLQFKHYDRDLIRDDLEHRVAFARDFLRFTKEDGKVLNSVAPVIAPLIKPTVDNVYSQLFRVRLAALAARLSLLLAHRPR